MSGPADNTPICSVCGRAYQVNGCTPEKCGQLWAMSSSGARPVGAEPMPNGPAANDNTVAHPLPWRWVLTSRAEDADDLDSLRDAAGNNLIMWTNYECLSVSDPYVRAVTERAGAMEELLRELQWYGHNVHAGPGRRLNWCCPVCENEEDDGHVQGCRVGALLAEIDAAKAARE